MPKGRPVKSEIRQNIVEILYFMKQGYGYEIYKAYIAIFPKVTMRSIYYHLKKGTSLGEFKVSKVEKEKTSVLKGCTNQWLQELNVVQAFHSAQPRHGGTGAVYVLLQKSDEMKRRNRLRFSGGRDFGALGSASS